MLTVGGELDRLMGFLAPARDEPLSLDRSLTPEQRREAWIREQRLSPGEAVLIPLDYDPAYPYPREGRS